MALRRFTDCGKKLMKLAEEPKLEINEAFDLFFTHYPIDEIPKAFRFYGDDEAFLNVDDDGSYTIGYVEFLRMMTHNVFNRFRLDGGKKLQELTEDQKQETNVAFDLFDSDASGEIELLKLKVIVRPVGPKAKKEEIQKIFLDVVDDSCGTIGHEDFLKMVTHKILNKDPNVVVLKVFRLFVDDEIGKVLPTHLKRVAKALTERMTDEELQLD